MIFKSKVQIEIETILSTKMLKSVSDLSNADVINYSFSSSEKNSLIEERKTDTKGLIFKGLISIIIALEKFKNNYYSWPTVNLYYSCFYLLKSSLCSRNVFLFRKERDMYYIDIDAKDKLTKVPSQHKSDHNASIYLFKLMFSNTDILQSNSINNKHSYEWLRTKREEVNYKYPTFLEPQCPKFCQEIVKNSSSTKFIRLVKKYIEDEDIIYAFQEDHAILALPLKRLVYSIQDAKMNGIDNLFNLDQDKIIKERLNKLKMYSIFQPILD